VTQSNAELVLLRVIQHEGRCIFSYCSTCYLIDFCNDQDTINMEERYKEAFRLAYLHGLIEEEEVFDTFL